jgi:hypothetical protein
MPSVEILQSPASTPVAITTVVPQPHNLAIVAVDFDPPLDYTKILANGGVTLLVAIENRGQSAEANVSLRARLLDPADGSRELLNETVEVRSLAAGEVSIVRFTPVSDLPARNHYHLVVEAQPVHGETDNSDNYRTYDIVLHPVN